MKGRREKGVRSQEGRGCCGRTQWAKGITKGRHGSERTGNGRSKEEAEKQAGGGTVSPSTKIATPRLPTAVLSTKVHCVRFRDA